MVTPVLSPTPLNSVVSSVLGTKTGTCTKSSGAAPAPVDEILAIDPEDTCDKLETSDQIKKAVIDQIYEKIAVNAPKITLNLDEIDVDSYLKVSPLGGASRLTRRQSSSRSLISSQISSSKWLKDDDYSSLPFLGVKPERNGVPKGILKNALVLPPIETCQIRSVSATPRRQSKSLSALSFKEQKYSGFKRKGDKDTFKWHCKFDIYSNRASLFSNVAHFICTICIFI